MNSNTRTSHTEVLRLFHEVTGFEQALVQQIVDTVEEAHLMDIRNHTMHSINRAMVDVPRHLQ